MPEMLARRVIHVAQVVGSPVERPIHYIYWELQIAIVTCESNADVEIANAVIAAKFARVVALGTSRLLNGHGSSPSCCIVGKTLTCISCIVRNRGRRLPTLSLRAIPSTADIGARVALLG